MNLLICYSKYKDPDKKYTNILVKELSPFGKVDVIDIDNYNGDYNFSEYSMVFAVGGDGTILKTIHMVHPCIIPIIGVNVGRKGYLAQINTDKIIESIHKIEELEYKVSYHSFLQGQVGGLSLIAANDILVSKSNPLSSCELILNIDNDFVGKYICDGILISSPFGSTAYNKSLKGPVVTLNSKVLIITPINSVNCNFESLVIDDNSTIEIEVVERGLNESVLVGFDGTYKSVELFGGEKIQISKSRKDLFELINLNGFDYFSNLKNK